MVSVIIPAYNSEKTIERAIFSIISQTYVDFELIIVDDGSTDNTLEICNRYANMYKNIHVISNEKNVGVGISRKIGFDNSSGDLVTFLDSDDMFLANFLEINVNLIINNNADMVYSSYRNIYSDGRIEDFNIDECVYSEDGVTNIYFDNPNKKFVGNLYRRELLDKITFDDQRLGEDVQMLFYVLHESEKVVSTSYIGYMRYVRLGSLFNNKPYKYVILKSILAEIKICDYLIQKELQYSFLFKNVFIKEIMYNYEFSISFETEDNENKEYGYDEMFIKINDWINNNNKYLNIQIGI